jgi:hypothetical protein
MIENTLLINECKKKKKKKKKQKEKQKDNPAMQWIYIVSI